MTRREQALPGAADRNCGGGQQCADVAQVFGALMAGSVAPIGGGMLYLSDVRDLGLAFGARKLARGAGACRSFGRARVEAAAALIFWVTRVIVALR